MGANEEGGCCIDREERIEKLVQLFEVLDQDNSGAIDVEEMRILGKVVSHDQSMPSVEETVYVKEERRR